MNLKNTFDWKRYYSRFDFLLLELLWHDEKYFIARNSITY